LWWRGKEIGTEAFQQCIQRIEAQGFGCHAKKNKTKKQNRSSKREARKGKARAGVYVKGKCGASFEGVR
jgi:hypothetical protein